MVKRILSLFILLLSLTAYGQTYRERILSFHSDIAIATDGTVTVTEHIRVYAAGKQIRRGIVRRIPITRTDRNGSKKKIDIQVLSVTCNGSTCPYDTERENGMRIINFGNDDRLAVPAEYEYTLTYSSRGHVGFFDTYDELYWNVTGNDWDFPIDQASATLTLPNDVSAISTACYTGAYGKAEKNCEITNEGNVVHFRTIAPLHRGEGLTVAVSFPNGIIERPAPPSALELFWQKYGSPISAAVCLLLLLTYCWLTWNKAGRDPRRPVVIPTFRPPHNWSAGIIRYLYIRTADDRGFTASLVSMAVKKAIRIDCEKKKYTLRALKRVETLSAEEQALYDTLFQKATTLAVSDKNHERFAEAMLQLKEALSTEITMKEYYLYNGKYIAGGFMVSLGVLGLYLLMCWSIIDTLPAFAFWYVALVLLVLVIFCIYAWLIQAPTPLGAQTTANIKGFRMYLKTAEENRLNLLTPPEQTPELFEQMLPYAIALNVENEWGRKFEAVLKKYNYTPDWYKGTEPLVYTALAHSFTSSISSAQVDPASSSSSGGSWSSGSGGGGFSGGGGGGGGGGGR